MKRQALGRAGERRAWRYLRRQGMRLICRNWRSKYGEIDIIGRDGDLAVIVEVRTSSGPEPFAGAPEFTVGPEKRERLKRLGRAWLQSSRWKPEALRFDVVALNRRGWLRWDLRHYPAAFDGD